MFTTPKARSQSARESDQFGLWGLPHMLAISSFWESIPYPARWSLMTPSARLRQPPLAQPGQHPSRSLPFRLPLAVPARASMLTLTHRYSISVLIARCCRPILIWLCHPRLPPDVPDSWLPAPVVARSSPVGPHPPPLRCLLSAAAALPCGPFD